MIYIFRKKLSYTVLLAAGICFIEFILTILNIGCPIKALTGISCAGCGMTRALLCALQLKFDAAFYFHPLFWIVPFFVPVYFLWEKIPNRIKIMLLVSVIFLFMLTYFIRLFFVENDIVTIEQGSITGSIKSSEQV